MGKPPQIRITENDRKEYARLVKNTKAKVRRTAKNVGSIIQDIQNGQMVQIDIRDKMNVPSLESFSSRAEFNQWKYETEKWNKGISSHGNFKRNKHGLAVTEHFMTVAENLNRKEINLAKQEKERLSKLQFTVEGIPQMTMEQRLLTMGRNNQTNVHIPKKFDFDGIKTLSYLKEKFEGMRNRADKDRKQARLEYFKEKYIESLERDFNSDSALAVYLIKQIPADIFNEMYKSEDLFQPLFNPSPKNGFRIQMMDDDEGHEQIKKIESYLEKYFTEGMDFDLKDF